MEEICSTKDNRDCIFCKIANAEIKSEKIYDDDNFFAIRDTNPKAEGHSLIISKKHFKTILDMPSSLGGEFIDAVKNVGLNLIKSGKCSGFNVIVNCGKDAGQIVHHLHAHVIPRKEGDGFVVGA